MKKSVFLIFIIIIAFTAFGQKANKKLSLPKVIELAREQSPDAILAKHRFKTSYWQFRSYKATLLPSLTLNANLLDFKNGISSVQQNDGSKNYISTQQNQAQLSGEINQNVSLTGGTFFINSGIERMDDFKIDSNGTSFNNTILNIGYSQPTFQYNPFKWEKKIEPLLYKEAEQSYLHQLEFISEKAIRYFYNLATAQLNVEIAHTNYSNNDTLYKIAKGRYEMGTIAENELLQLELAYLNSKSQLAQSKINFQYNMFSLRSFLGFNNLVVLELDIQTQVPIIDVPLDKALAYAKTNNVETITLSRQLLEAERDVAKARAENRFNANLYLSVGFDNNAYTINETYIDPNNRQTIRAGIQVPILDWGEGKGKYRMAQSNQEVVKTQVNQSRIDFEQEIMLKVLQFNEQDNQVLIAAKADTIARKRYEVAKQRFLIGKISVLDLNTAATEKDIALRNNLSAQRIYWTYFYNIRQFTLFDFVNMQTLQTNFENLTN